MTRRRCPRGGKVALLAAASWVPAEDLEALNDNIVGPIEVIPEFRA